MSDAGKWIAIDRGSLDVEAVQGFEAIPPASFPLAERIPAPQLIALFTLRERLPKQNRLSAEANSLQITSNVNGLPVPPQEMTPLLPEGACGEVAPVVFPASATI